MWCGGLNWTNWEQATNNIFLLIVECIKEKTLVIILCICKKQNVSLYGVITGTKEHTLTKPKHSYHRCWVQSEFQQTGNFQPLTLEVHFADSKFHIFISVRF